jgi:membrane protein YdbS with pleckstrin-like domain
MVLTTGYSGSGSSSRASFPSPEAQWTSSSIVTHTAARQPRSLTGFPVRREKATLSHEPGAGAEYDRSVDLHPGENSVFQGHPSWRALLSFYIGGAVGTAAIAVIVALVASVVAGVIVGIVLFALLLIVGFVRRMTTLYAVTTERLYIRRGLLSKQVQQTRIDRVQNVNANQRLRERILRVGTVDFDTAGTDDSEFRFVGIANPSDVVDAVYRAQREAAPSDGVQLR